MQFEYNIIRILNNMNLIYNIIKTFKSMNVKNIFYIYECNFYLVYYLKVYPLIRKLTIPFVFLLFYVEIYCTINNII